MVEEYNRAWRLGSFMANACVLCMYRGIARVLAEHGYFEFIYIRKENEVSRVSTSTKKLLLVLFCTCVFDRPPGSRPFDE